MIALPGHLFSRCASFDEFKNFRERGQFFDKWWQSDRRLVLSFVFLSITSAEAAESICEQLHRFSSVHHELKHAVFKANNVARAERFKQICRLFELSRLSIKELKQRESETADALAEEKRRHTVLVKWRAK